MGETDLQVTITRLGEFSAKYQPLFARREQREHASKYLEGLLSPLQRNANRSSRSPCSGRTTSGSGACNISWEAGAGTTERSFVNTRST